MISSKMQQKGFEMKKLGRITLALAMLTTATVTQARNKVIYGPDDRKDLHEVKRALHLDLAASTAAMIEKNSITTDGDSVTISSSTLESRGICASEKFSQQQTAAMCSGFLVGEDLLVTAGHCIQSKSDCRRYNWVFNYAHKEKNSDINVTTEDVYGCKEIIERTLDNSTMDDYALIRLDRKVVNRTPLTVRKEGKIESGTKIVVIGHPTGLPTKVADNAWVRDNNRDKYFAANLDTFGGNSGSAVFNADTGVVEGILVRGEQDYEYDYSQGCRVVFKCKDNGCRGEDVTRITNIQALMEM